MTTFVEIYLCCFAVTAPALAWFAVPTEPRKEQPR